MCGQSSKLVSGCRVKVALQWLQFVVGWGMVLTSCLHSHNLFQFGGKFFACVWRCERAASVCGGQRGATTVVVRHCT